MTDSEVITVPLHEVAHGRTGDKGNRLNVSLFPYIDAAFETLAEQLSEARVLEAFAHRGASAVKRHDLPNLPGFNFVIDNVLEGGVNASLNLDGHGKSLSYYLLGLTVTVPRKFVPKRPG